MNHIKIIFSYNRPQMLSNLLDEIGHSIVIDDGSGYKLNGLLDKCDYYRFNHKGKKGFWLQWQYAFEIAQESDAEWFFFGPDDIKNVQMDKIWSYKRDEPFALNYMNVGPPRGWTHIPHIRISEDLWRVCYVDCAFITNRRTLELLKFEMYAVDELRFMNPNISSGVGQQLSQRLAKLGVPMLMVDKSLAYHGDHHSEMNTEERKIHPLVSR